MLKLGYMAKKIEPVPDHLAAFGIEEMSFVSGCIHKNFADYISLWRHNGFWFFDSPDILRSASSAADIDLCDTQLFYFTTLPLAFDEADRTWIEIVWEHSFITEVEHPADFTLLGFDIVTHSCGTSAECSPLSCNGLAEKISTNRYGLIENVDDAVGLLEAGAFDGSEPGPMRVVAVHRVPGWRPAERPTS